MNHYTPFNIEGLNKIELVEASMVLSITPGDVLTGAPVRLVLQFGASFEAIPMVKGSGQFTEEHQRDSSGDHFMQNIAFSHAKNRKEADTWLLTNQHKDFIVKVTDRNLNIRIIGSIESPARLSAPMNNPASGRNEYAFTFYAESDDRAPYLQDGETVTNAGKSFSTDFSTDFSL